MLDQAPSLCTLHQERATRCHDSARPDSVLSSTRSSCVGFGPGVPRTPLGPLPPKSGMPLETSTARPDPAAHDERSWTMRSGRERRRRRRASRPPDTPRWVTHRGASCTQRVFGHPHRRSFAPWNSQTHNRQNYRQTVQSQTNAHTRPATFRRLPAPRGSLLALPLAFVPPSPSTDSIKASRAGPRTRISGNTHIAMRCMAAVNACRQLFEERHEEVRIDSERCLFSR